MATVAVSFTPLPAHVRTARFIAASVARRAGVSEDMLDEVRLAVSEACSLAVRRHRRQAPTVPVQMRLTDDADRFTIEVLDSVARTADTPAAAGTPATEDMPAATGTPATDDMPATDDDDDDEDAFGLPGGSVARLGAALGRHDGADPVDARARERIGLAVIVGLVDDVDVAYLEAGSVVTMRWPLAQSGSVGVQSGDTTAL